MRSVRIDDVRLDAGLARGNRMTRLLAFLLRAIGRSGIWTVA